MKKRMSVKKVVLIFVILIVLITVAGNILRYVQNRGASAADTFPSGWEVPDYNVYMEGKKETASDIKGMSQYEKYQMGLDYRDGSDTDGDGLTDQEEIEIYGSDPLKESTAGDLYTDGYKVEHDMDLFTSYPYEGSLSVKGNACKEMLLTVDEPSDFHAVVEDTTDTYPLSCFGIDTIYKGYGIHGYHGTVSIEVNEILSANSITWKEARFWVVQGALIVDGLSELEECRYEKNGDTVCLDYEFETDNYYYIYITGKKKTKVGSFLTSGTSIKESPETVTCLLYGSPVITAASGKKFVLEYSGLGDEESKEAFLESWKDNYKKRFGDDFYYEVEAKAVKKEDIQRKYGAFQKALPFMETTFGEPTEIYMLAFVYVKEDNIPASLQERKVGGSKFDRYVDELPFPNFESYIGAYGNCAGITHLTAYLYNRGSLPASGSYDCPVDGERTTVDWELSSDKENHTLMDVGLYDYKTMEFVEEHSKNSGDRLEEEELTAGEKEFVDLVGCYWAEGNDRIDLSKYLQEGNSQNKYSKIKKMIKYLDQDKILDVYLYFRGGFGHAVNIYAYHYNSKGEVVFHVYDNNLPQDSRKGFSMNYDKCYLVTRRIENENGPDTFEYLYWPLGGKQNQDYMAASDPKLMSQNAFVVMDEEWNIIK